MIGVSRRALARLTKRTSQGEDEAYIYSHIHKRRPCVCWGRALITMSVRLDIFRMPANRDLSRSIVIMNEICHLRYVPLSLPPWIVHLPFLPFFCELFSFSCRHTHCVTRILVHPACDGRSLLLIFSLLLLLLLLASQEDA